MPKVKIREDIELEVLCEHRASFYVPFLETALKAFVSFFNDLLVKKDQNFIEKSLFEKGLYESLALLLDDAVLDFLIPEIEVHQKNIDWEKLSKKTSNDQARKLLIDYIGQINLNDFFEKYPKLKKLLNTLTKNFIFNIQLCLTRVIRHQFELRKFFLKLPLNENIQLLRIISSESDLYQEGKQVLILEFDKVSNFNMLYKVVYKPSSIACDAWLVGNTQTLRDEGDERVDLSMLEMLNEYLSVESQLPTYLIYPCSCLEDGIHQQNYGFIEYLSHEPWRSFNLGKHVLSFHLSNKKFLSINTELENRVNTLFQENLEKSYNNSVCDFIIDNNDPEKQKK